MLLLVNTSAADALSAVAFIMSYVTVLLGIFHGSMVFLLEDGVGLDGLEFGLEVTDGMTKGAAIGTTTCIGEFVAIVLGLVARSAPAGAGQKRRFTS